MISLRKRITLLLVISIISVVGLATFAAVSVMRRPPPEPALQPMGRLIELLTKLPDVEQQAISLDIRSRPASGVVDTWYTAGLNDAVGRAGDGVIVTQEEDKVGKFASVPLQDGRWLIVPIPDFSPPLNVWMALSGWIAIIVLGATAVSLYFASVLTRPLEMLEAAVARVGPDGVLVRLPEGGSGEVRATARALNHLSARLKSAMESRMRLVAAAGHDLRTPMTRMRLRAEFLPDDDRAKWLNDLDELDRISDSAIKLVREEIGGGSSDPVALGAAVLEVVEELASVDLKVELGRIDEVYVRAGSLGLRRALRNLMVNAATHGKGCQVEVVGQDRKAVITIADRGPGIPPELLDRAFEPFFRVDPGRRQSVPGAGLGLAIVKEIIEHYGGRVTLANQPGGGLRQTIVLDQSLVLHSQPHQQG
ncbi:HAMP domain-containing protein [Mesorhizobium sp. B2-3-3]|nr:HAMP domain-containing protein [Mesorhizobium sp. B2-3-3]